MTPRSSCTFSTHPERLLQRGASRCSRCRLISASAQSRLSATPGAFCSGSPRSACMTRAICCARRSDRPGTRACRISISCASDGYGSQRNRQRRRRASDSSRVRLLVRITCGLCRARIVPSSGIVTCHSASTSRRNASKASSARSTSSMSSTGDRSRVIASSSGRLSRNRSLNMYASRSSRLDPSVSLKRAWSIWRG